MDIKNLMLAFLGSVPLALVAENITVADRVVAKNNIELTCTTKSITSEPQELPTPLFHFDCMRREGWTVNAQNRVSKIPSLVGDRWLNGGDSSDVWSSNDTVHRAPFLRFDEKLGGLPVLDFNTHGNNATFCGMLFNPIVDEETGGTPTCVMRNIGTVVAVWYSDDEYNGGYLLSGGYTAKGSDTAFSARNWSRSDFAYAPQYLQSVFHSRTPVSPAVVRHDGKATDGVLVGFKGGWEVVSVQPDNTYAPSAAGVGGGMGRWSSGGMKIAEMYIFGTRLSAEQLAETEAYLHRKWLGTDLIGYNGVAELGDLRVNNSAGAAGAIGTINVAAGETMTIGRLRGGHGTNAAVVKTGAGALEFGETVDFGGDVKLNEGTLQFSKRTIPSVESLPNGLIFRLDPSDKSGSIHTVDEADGKYVTLIDNLADFTISSDVRRLRPLSGNAELRPWVISDALGEGMDVLDFGPFTYGGKRDTTPGRVLEFVGADGSTRKPLGDAVTIVAVVGAQNGGGHILGGNGKADAFERGDDAWMSAHSWSAASLLTDLTSIGDASLKASEVGLAYVDGIRRPTTKGYPQPGYQVVALQTQGSDTYMLGGFNNVRAGGLRLGECLIFGRVLSEDEIRDVEAYLMRKWLGRTAPGYSIEAAAGRTDIRRLVVSADAEIAVDEGRSARIGELKTEPTTTLIKRGKGVLEVESGDAANVGAITVNEGTLRVVATPDVASDCELASGAALHLDACDVKSVEAPYGKEVTDKVLYWFDQANGNAAYASYDNGKYCPYLNTTDTCNGHPVMDFGPYNTTGNATMPLARHLDGVRSVYVLWGSQNGGGNLFGTHTAAWGDSQDTSSGYGWLDFTRGGTGMTIGYNGNCLVNSQAEIYFDGVKAKYSTVPNGGYQLVEIHTPVGVSIPGLMADRGYNLGGGRIGEVLAYTRSLSPRERVATRNYLMKKWLGTDASQFAALPEKTVTPTKLGAVTLAGGNLEVASGSLAGDLVYGDGSTLRVALGEDGNANPAIVEGSITYGKNMTVEFSGLETLGSELQGKTITIAKAGSLVNVDALKEATLSGFEFTGRTRPRFTERTDGTLTITFGGKGLVMLIK